MDVQIAQHVDQEPTRIIDSGFGIWHAIFQINGEDFCREDAPNYIAFPCDATVWANRHLRQSYQTNPKLPKGLTFQIERW